MQETELFKAKAKMNTARSDNFFLLMGTSCPPPLEEPTPAKQMGTGQSSLAALGECWASAKGEKAFHSVTHCTGTGDGLSVALTVLQTAFLSGLQLKPAFFSPPSTEIQKTSFRIADSTQQSRFLLLSHLFSIPTSSARDRPALYVH